MVNKTEKSVEFTKGILLHKTRLQISSEETIK